jgi:hypothetical protein
MIELLISKTDLYVLNILVVWSNKIKNRPSYPFLMSESYVTPSSIYFFPELI